MMSLLRWLKKLFAASSASLLHVSATANAASMSSIRGNIFRINTKTRFLMPPQYKKCLQSVAPPDKKNENKRMSPDLPYKTFTLHRLFLLKVRDRNPRHRLQTN